MWGIWMFLFIRAPFRALRFKPVCKIKCLCAAVAHFNRLLAATAFFILLHRAFHFNRGRNISALRFCCITSVIKFVAYFW